MATTSFAAPILPSPVQLDEECRCEIGCWRLPCGHQLRHHRCTLPGHRLQHQYRGMGLPLTLQLMPEIRGRLQWRAHWCQIHHLFACLQMFRDTMQVRPPLGTTNRAAPHFQRWQREVPNDAPCPNSQGGPCQLMPRPVLGMILGLSRGATNRMN